MKKQLICAFLCTSMVLASSLPVFAEKLDAPLASFDVPPKLRATMPRRRWLPKC